MLSDTPCARFPFQLLSQVENEYFYVFSCPSTFVTRPQREAHFKSRGPPREAQSDHDVPTVLIKLLHKFAVGRLFF